MEKIRVALLEQPGDVFAGMAEIADFAFDDQLHVRAEEFGGACDLPAGKYCWNRTQKAFVAMLPEESSQRVADFMRIAQLGVNLAASHLADNDARGADSAELIALARRHFPQYVKATLAPAAVKGGGA